MKLKKLAAFVLAFIGIGAPVMGRSVAQSYNNNPTQGKEMNITRVATVTKKFKIPHSFGGSPMMYAGYGIPPHIYGIYYAKRGTHKRSNRK